jgi:hypothetical protein
MLLIPPRQNGFRLLFMLRSFPAPVVRRPAVQQPMFGSIVELLYILSKIAGSGRNFTTAIVDKCGGLGAMSDRRVS